MAFYVTNSFSAATTIVASEVNQNFTDVENKINGNITGADIVSGANIANDRLANDDFEIVVGATWTGAPLDSGITAFLVVGGIPYDSGGGTGGYTILGIEHMTYISVTAPTGGVTMDLKYGNHTDGFTTIKAGLTTGVANQQTQVTSLSSTTAGTSATRPNFFILDITTAGTGWATGSGSWGISIKLKRVNGLRA